MEMTGEEEHECKELSVCLSVCPWSKRARVCAEIDHGVYADKLCSIGFIFFLSLIRKVIVFLLCVSLAGLGHVRSKPWACCCSTLPHSMQQLCCPSQSLCLQFFLQYIHFVDFCFCWFYIFFSSPLAHFACFSRESSMRFWVLSSELYARREYIGNIRYVCVLLRTFGEFISFCGTADRPLLLHLLCPFSTIAYSGVSVGVAETAAKISKRKKWFVLRTH